MRYRSTEDGRRKKILPEVKEGRMDDEKMLSGISLSQEQPISPCVHPQTLTTNPEH